MTETVIAFPRSKEGLTKLIRSILGDIVMIATTIDEIFDQCSAEQLDEMKRRLEFIQAEVEALKEHSPREAAGWITG
jgi:phosphopantetheine adenylyltransferase